MGRAIYEQYCGGCHGMKLEGQPDWMKRKADGKMPAPPHNDSGHTWHHSDDQLNRIILEGLASIAPGYETDMPAFAGTLSEEQVEAILDYIKGTWPDKLRAAQELRQ